MNHVFCAMISLGVVLYLTGSAKADVIFDFKSIDVPGSNFTQAFKINDFGQIVGDYRVPPNSVDHGYLLSGNTYFKLDVDSANGINNSGQIVGETGNDGFLLSGGNYTTLDVPGSTFTQPVGINDAGQIVGVYGAGSNHGFLLSGGAYSTLDVPGATYTQPNDINDSGQIVGYYVSSGLFHGFVLNAAGYSTLDFPGSTFTRAYGINDAGLMVGDYEDVNGSRHGFLLSGGNYTTVEFPGANFTIASGINNAGQIVGEYASGTTGGFLAVPVPEPHVFTSFMIGSLTLVAFACQRQYRASRRDSQTY